MHSIDFKNFRRFEKLKEPIELSGITFFVGGNNAGKSTVVKAMLMLLENLKYDWNLAAEVRPIFRFGSAYGQDLHIGTFGRALHKPYPEIKEIELSCKLDDYNFYYVLSGDVESQRLNAEVHLIQIQNDSENWKIIVDFKENKVYFTYPESLFIEDFENTRRLSVDSIQSMIRKHTHDLHSLEAKLNEYDEIRQAVIQKDIIAKKNQIKTLRTQWDSLQLSLKEDKILHDELPIMADGLFKEQNLCDVICNCYQERLKDADATFLTTDSINTRAVSEQTIKDCRTKETWFLKLKDRIQLMIRRKEFIYIPSHSVAQRIFFSREDRNDYMSAVISEYQSKYKEGGLQETFVQTWMNRFEIGHNIKIKTIQGEAFSITVTNMKGADVPLADMGMGSIQVILLLLKLATLIDEDRAYSPLVFIEEPEQNMHPSLQSKLALLFEYMHRQYNLRFVVETHSEYLIRKTQAMIATEEENVSFENNPFRVYYFPDNGTPYDMVYQESGLFEEKFDKGFFDETSRQYVKVVNRARELKK